MFGAARPAGLTYRGDLMLCLLVVVSMGTPEPAGDRLREQSAVLRTVTRELMLSLGETAGRIAATVDEVARVYEEIAASSVSAGAAQALERAEHARQFAAHERDEQHRWAARAEGV